MCSRYSPPLRRGGGKAYVKPRAGLGRLANMLGIVRRSALPPQPRSPPCTGSCGSLSSSCVEPFPDGLDLVAKAFVLLELVHDLLDRVQGRRVVAAAEGLPDHRQGGGRLFADNEHGDLAREDDVLVAPLAL